MKRKPMQLVTQHSSEIHCHKISYLFGVYIYQIWAQHQHIGFTMTLAIWPMSIENWVALKDKEMENVTISLFRWPCDWYQIIQLFQILHYNPDQDYWKLFLQSSKKHSIPYIFWHCWNNRDNFRQVQLFGNIQLSWLKPWTMAWSWTFPIDRRLHNNSCCLENMEKEIVLTKTFCDKINCFFYQ